MNMQILVRLSNDANKVRHPLHAVRRRTLLAFSATCLNIMFVLALLAVTISLRPVSAATIEQAWSGDKYRLQFKLEGEIVKGDASRLLEKLLDYNTIFGPVISSIWVLSKGGDAEEAMKIGYIIRRLRLKTYAPTRYLNLPPSVPILFDDKDNGVCASACFLIYAAGVERYGNYLALHRPFIKKDDAVKLSDVDFEDIQRKAMNSVRSYLQAMDIDLYWIDILLSTNSQNAYITKPEEAEDGVHAFVRTIPPIEEAQLLNCKDNTDYNKRRLNEMQASGSFPKEEFDGITADIRKFDECKRDVLDSLRAEALKREADDDMNANCHISDVDTKTISHLAEKYKMGHDLSYNYDASSMEEHDRLQWDEAISHAHNISECRSNHMRLRDLFASNRQRADIDKMEKYDNGHKR